MRKSIFIVLLLTFIFTLSACGDSEPTPSETASHTHSFGEWVVTNGGSCTEGLERERSCSCGETETEHIEAGGHTEVVDKAVAATCSKEGATEGKHCSVCGEIFVAQKSIEKLPHTEVDIPAVRATCTKEGKTRGKQCSVCKEITKAQRVIEKEDHIFGEWTIVKKATTTAEGTRKHTCTICNTTVNDVIDIRKEDQGKYGCASNFSETTVIVSVFANHGDYSWDLDLEEDKKVFDTMYEHLMSAAYWLEAQGAFYSADTKFICDWKANPDLYYTADNLFSSNTEQRKFIESNINSDDLMQKYNAQNILYMFYYDVPENNIRRSNCIYKTPQNSAQIETINIFDRFCYDQAKVLYYYTPAATFAHEILHAFGAPDLYYKNSRVPQEYVDYCNQIKSNDIMFTINLGKSISVKFSELCAYYVGLKNTCSEVEQWGLGKSERLYTSQN